MNNKCSVIDIDGASINIYINNFDQKKIINAIKGYMTRVGRDLDLINITRIDKNNYEIESNGLIDLCFELNRSKTEILYNRDPIIRKMCKENDIRSLTLLLKSDLFDIIGYEDEYSMPLLCSAAESTDLDIVDFLVNLNYKQGKTSYDETPIKVAVSLNNINMAERFLQEDLFNMEYSSEAIYRAVNDNNVDMVKLLLRYGTKQITNIYGKTSINLAMKSKNNYILYMLVENSIKQETLDKYENVYCLLSEAVYYGFIDIVALILKNGIDINSFEYNPMIYLSENFQTIGDLLMDYGFTQTPSRKDNKTPLYHACFNENIALVSYLLFHEATHEPCRYGNTPLYIAASLGNKKIIEMLLQYGAKYTANNLKFGPIHIAAYNNRYEALKILLSGEYQYAADINNETPLYVACKMKCIESVKIIIEKFITIPNSKLKLHPDNKFIKFVKKNKYTAPLTTSDVRKLLKNYK